MLDPRVALRPEKFGALAYHFGTRRLSFLKSRKLLTVVQQLGEHTTGRDACRAAEVPDSEMPIYEAALGRLAATGMIRERDQQ
jgi:putative mycofactocin binding protein MftB